MARHDPPLGPCVPWDVPWERLPDAYLTRFGPLLHTEVDYRLDPNVPLPHPGSPDAGALRRWLDAEHQTFFQLTFGPMTEEEPRAVRATFCAAPLAGHELFMTTTVPFGLLWWALGPLVRDHAPLAPGAVVRMDLAFTPFNALLLAPPGAGSIPLGEVDGVERFALSVVPLTPAETGLAADSMDQLVAALRANGVLDATDPMRDCVLVPEQTRQFWAHMRPELLDLVQHRHEQRSARLTRLLSLSAPKFLIGKERLLVVEAEMILRYIAARPVDPGSPAERGAEIARKRRALFEQLGTHIAPLLQGSAFPAPLRMRCAQVVGLTLGTHPLAEQLFLSAEGRTLKTDLDAEVLLPRAVNQILMLQPGADQVALLAGGRRGWANAREEATDDGFVAPNVLWERMLASMFLALDDRSTPEGEATRTAIRAGLLTANRVLLDQIELPPMERFKGMARAIVIEMAKTYLESLGFEVPVELSHTSGPPALTAPKKGRKRKMGSKKLH